MGRNCGNCWKSLTAGVKLLKKETTYVQFILIHTVHTYLYVCMYVLLCFISQQASVQKWLVLVKKLSDEASVIYRDSMVLNILVSTLYTYIHTLYTVHACIHTYMHAYNHTRRSVSIRFAT
jgi:hypothetical protein